MAKMMVTSRGLLSLLVLFASGPSTSKGAEGFVARSASSTVISSQPAFLSRRGGATSLSAKDGSVDGVPSWEDLELDLEKIRSSRGEEPKPVLTLYRDTNGWCPFCERVWVAIRAKGLPYQETLVPLQGKPEWYKQMVPTALVPAVLFHGDDETTNRELVWESDAILQALDDKFPDTPRLMRTEDAGYQEALDRQSRLQSAGFKFAYGNRNGTLTEAEIEENRASFESMLDEVDESLSGGGFMLGEEFSGIDAIMIPTMERWRYQLPLTEDMDILEGRPNLRKWFDHMDSYPAYSGRVAGDEYSWTATASMFLRYFGGGEDKPKVAAGIARADAAAEELAKQFANGSLDSSSKESALEAASKLVSNHEAVLEDCLRDDPKSQAHIPRGDSNAKDTVDALLRHVAFLLVQLASGDVSSISDLSQTHGVVGAAMDTSEQGALALHTVAKRLCVPRDMGASSAALLRGALATVADSLVESGATVAEPVVSS